MSSNRDVEWKTTRHRTIKRILHCLLCALLSVSSQSLFADPKDYTLELKPIECVSLYKGQTCHTTLEFVFTAPAAGNYCVYKKDDKEAITCWESIDNGTFSQEFSTDEEVVFELKSRQDDDKILSSATLNLSWVYQVPDKKRLAWRLF